MTTQLLTEKHANDLDGVLGCYDRIMITGSLPDLCHAKGITHHMFANGMGIFDYPRWAEPMADAIRKNAESIAEAHGLTIEYIRTKNFRKEERIQAILCERGTQPGLVHILSAVETCMSFRPWHDKGTDHNYLKRDSGKCLHYYFYFIDPDSGLCHLRVPTWCPFNLQFTATGMLVRPCNWLAKALPASCWTMRSGTSPTTNWPINWQWHGTAIGCATNSIVGHNTTVIRHHMGPAAIKMYDKFARILRIEVTVNDVSFFRHRRKVEHRNGEPTIDWAPMK
jgi:hypothetical protein